MSPRKIIFLSLAFIVGFGTFVVMRSTTPETPQQAALKTKEILAAARDLPTGTILKEMDLKWVTWPDASDASKMYVKGTVEINVLVGAILREGLRADEPLTQGRVVQPKDHGFLAAVLNPGMRAVSINLTPTGNVAGFVFPGDYVDVIMSHSFTRKDVTSMANDRRISQTILSNVRVLALDQKTDNQSTEPKIAQIATLEVTPKQAEELALALDMVGTGGVSRGTLTLALRSLATVEAAAESAAYQAGGQAGSAAASSTASAASSSSSTLPQTGLPTPPTPDAGPTWDSDVSSAYPNVHGEDGLMQKVQIMRGKEKTDAYFERRK